MPLERLSESGSTFSLIGSLDVRKETMSCEPESAGAEHRRCTKPSNDIRHDSMNSRSARVTVTRRGGDSLFVANFFLGGSVGMSADWPWNSTSLLSSA